jgi:hypothetical protein
VFVAEDLGEDGGGVGACSEGEHVVDDVAIEGLEALAVDGDGDVVERGHAITVRSGE